MKKYVYKVVGLVDKDNFVSCTVSKRQKYCLKYCLNKTTTPKIGEIFVFKYLKDAKNFLGFSDSERILRCKYEGNLTKRESLSIFVTADKIDDFWEGKLPQYFTERSPTGTYTVSAVKPVTVIH